MSQDNSNSNKNLHGQSNKDSVLSIIEQLLKSQYISDYKKSPSYKRENYTHSKYSADYLISFDDNDNWLIFTTTSYRDRVKQDQWDAMNIKSVDSSITCTLLVYPEGLEEKEKHLFELHQQRLKERSEFSYIDYIVSQNEFWVMVEMHALENENKGQKLNLIGNNFESRISSILNNPDNLKRIKSTDSITVGSNYEIFSKIIDCFNLPIEKVAKLEATCDKKDIGKIPGNKNPKTDVLVTVSFDDGVQKNYTISCKQTTSTAVSVHEYAASDFAAVLNADNELADLLNKFQQAGSRSAFGPENSERLEELLKPHLKELFMWVIGGHGGPGDPNKQLANYILINHSKDNNSSISIYSISDYYQKLMESNIEGMFGTIFGWTYPSKKRGKKIQLKLKIIE